MAKKRSDKIGSIMRKLLSEEAEARFQIQGLAGQRSKYNNAELIARKVMEKAIQTGEQWAVQFVAERAEGKAVAAEKIIEEDRSTEEKLTDVTLQHLNALAKTITSGQQQAAADNGHPQQADPPARADLPVPQNGNHHPQGAAGKPPLAAGTQAAGGNQSGASGATASGIVSELRLLDKRLRMDVHSEDGGAGR